MDLTPLMLDDSLTVADLSLSLLRKFKDDVTDRILLLNRRG